jgi:hypothetical protein
VRALIEEERQTVRAMSERGWRASVRWACEVAEGKPGADGKPPTNLDRHNAATFLARVRGEYAPARVEVATTAAVVFRGFRPGRVLDAEAPVPALPAPPAPAAPSPDGE